ncbi:MAG: transcriptional regulator [Xanthomonadales bacterium]
MKNIDNNLQQGITVRAIHNEDDYQIALSKVLTLSDTAKENTPEMEMLEILSILVEAYEREHYVIAAPDPVAAIQFRMEQQGLSRKDIIPILGTNSRVSEIFNHKRKLTLGMISRLHNELNIPYESLIS